MLSDWLALIIHGRNPEQLVEFRMDGRQIVINSMPNFAQRRLSTAVTLN